MISSVTVGDVLEFVAAICLTIAAFLYIGPMLALLAAGLYLAYIAQGLANVSIGRQGWRRASRACAHQFQDMQVRVGTDDLAIHPVCGVCLLDQVTGTRAVG